MQRIQQFSQRQEMRTFQCSGAVPFVSRVIESFSCATRRKLWHPGRPDQVVGRKKKEVRLLRGRLCEGVLVAAEDLPNHARREDEAAGSRDFRPQFWVGSY